MAQSKYHFPCLPRQESNARSAGAQLIEQFRERNYTLECIDGQGLLECRVFPKNVDLPSDAAPLARFTIGYEDVFLDSGSSKEARLFEQWMKLAAEEFNGQPVRVNQRG